MGRGRERPAALRHDPFRPRQAPRPGRRRRRPGPRAHRRGPLGRRRRLSRPHHQGAGAPADRPSRRLCGRARRHGPHCPGRPQAEGIYRREGRRRRRGGWRPRHRRRAEGRPLRRAAGKGARAHRLHEERKGGLHDRHPHPRHPPRLPRCRARRGKRSKAGDPADEGRQGRGLARRPAHHHRPGRRQGPRRRGLCGPGRRSEERGRLRRHRGHRRCRLLHPARQRARPRGAPARQLGLFPRPRRADAARAHLQRPLLAPRGRGPAGHRRAHALCRRRPQARPYVPPRDDALGRQTLLSGGPGRHRRQAERQDRAAPGADPEAPVGRLCVPEEGSRGPRTARPRPAGAQDRPEGRRHRRPHHRAAPASTPTS